MGMVVPQMGKPWVYWPLYRPSRVPEKSDTSVPGSPDILESHDVSPKDIKAGGGQPSYLLF